MQESVRCPTWDLPSNPLFTHVIPRHQCLKLQSEFFHKCAHCVHRAPEPFYPSVGSSGEAGGNGVRPASANGNESAGANGASGAGANGRGVRRGRTAVRLARLRP